MIRSALPFLLLGFLVLFIVFLVKFIRKRRKRNLIIAIVSLLMFVLTILFAMVLAQAMFILGSFGRVGMLGMGEQHVYPYHDYNYYPYTDYDNPGRADRIEKEEPDFYEIVYGIHTNPNLMEIVKPDGEMILRRGPPFTFQLYFTRINIDVEYIHFNEITLTTDRGETCDFFTLEISRFENGFSGGDYIMAVYSVKAAESAIELFRRSGYVYLGNLVRQGRAEMENNLERRRLARLRENRGKTESPSYQDFLAYISRLDMDQLINAGKLSLIIGFSYLPIDFEVTDSLKIKIDFDVFKNDGTTANFIIEDTYNRKYVFYERAGSNTPPESFGKRSKT